MLEAGEEILIPYIGDKWVRHVLHGSQLFVGWCEATAEVVESQLCATLGLVAQTQGGREVERRASKRCRCDASDDGVTADA